MVADQVVVTAQEDSALPREEIEMDGPDDFELSADDEGEDPLLEAIERLHKPCPGTMPKPKALVYAIERYLDGMCSRGPSR